LIERELLHCVDGGELALDWFLEPTDTDLTPTLVILAGRPVIVCSSSFLLSQLPHRHQWRFYEDLSAHNDHCGSFQGMARRRDELARNKRPEAQGPSSLLFTPPCE